MKKNLMLIGAGGHGKVCADIASKQNKWDSIYFLDDNINTSTCIGYKVVGKIDDFTKFADEAEFFVSIGNNAIRSSILKRLESSGIEIASLIHPNAIVGLDVSLGKGTVVMPGVVINASAKIGKGCIINTGSSVDHDNVISDYVHISPGVHLGGTVIVGESTQLSIGSSVANNITIFSNCIIGAGAVVIHDIMEPGTYIGVPAKKI
jgi:sugar O-acyltransferase (sialic acid O-acetyltransferase NeuD family)